MRRFVEEFKSWHRALPDPPGTPKFNIKTFVQVLRETNVVYFRGFKSSFSNVFQAWTRDKSKQLVQTQQQQQELDKQSNATGKAAADALKSTMERGPQAMREWMAPKIALVSDAMAEFGKGYREGKASSTNFLEWNNTKDDGEVDKESSKRSKNKD